MSALRAFLTTDPAFYLANAALVVLAAVAGAWLQVLRDTKEKTMIAKITVMWTEFLYAQEMRHDSLFQFWDSLKRWWAYRPRIIHCAFCHAPMWWNGARDDVYCGPDCAYYGPQAKWMDEDELPF